MKGRENHTTSTNTDRWQLYLCACACSGKAVEAEARGRGGGWTGGRGRGRRAKEQLAEWILQELRESLTPLQLLSFHFQGSSGDRAALLNGDLYRDSCTHTCRHTWLPVSLFYYNTSGFKAEWLKR